MMYRTQWVLYVLAFVAGFASLELEIIGTRVIGPVFGETMYVWTALISVTLLYLAVGYYVGGWLADSGRLHVGHLGMLLVGVGAYVGLLPIIARPVLRGLVGLGMVSGPLIVSGILFVLPMVALGMVVPVLVKGRVHHLGDVGEAAGGVYAVATLGSIAGALMSGFVLLPLVGLRMTTTVTGVLVLKGLVVGLLVIVVVVVPFVKPVVAEIVFEEESFYSTIRVADEGSGLSLYRGLFEITGVNSAGVRGNTYDDLYEFAFLLKEDVSRVLVIGFGGGITVAELAENHPNVDFDVVEIDPALEDVARDYFDWGGAVDGKGAGKIDVAVEDGRHYLATHGQYDLIIVDFALTHYTPYFSTREFFLLVEEHLTDDGVYSVLVPGSFEGEYKVLLDTVVNTGLGVFEDYLILSTTPDARRDSVNLFPVMFVQEEIDGERLLETVEGHVLERVTSDVPFGEIVVHSDTFVRDGMVVVSTDDNPVYARHFVGYMDEYRRRFLESHVDWYLP
jgi:spermidine synthase